VNALHRFPLLILCLALLSACAPTVANRGNLVDTDKLAEVRIGESTREDVAGKLGSPTEVGAFDENVWHYFGRRTEQYAFFNPEVTDQQAVEIRFNDQGVVTEVNRLDPAAAQDIAPVARRTPTYGRDMTFLEQLMGNLGRPGGVGKKK
jgi:outer membrane protein assembly factor BamE (lipoprotein component of BamABCDE complex)